MKSLYRISASVAAVFSMAACFSFAISHAHSQSPGNARQGAPMTSHASGPFDVKATPQKPDNPDAEAAQLSRMSLDKQYHGSLEASSKGEMLASRPDAKGSGVYVALERVTGTLNGRSGSFVLHHTGIMTRGTPHLTIEVVPDSGTDQLTGLTGKMSINIAEGGKHSYDFEYTLPEKQ